MKLSLYHLQCYYGVFQYVKGTKQSYDLAISAEKDCSIYLFNIIIIIIMKIRFKRYILQVVL